MMTIYETYLNLQPDKDYFSIYQLFFYCHELNLVLETFD